MKEILLDFEKELIPIESQIERLVLKNESEEHEARLKEFKTEKKKLLSKIYKDLTPWQICNVARHPNRPYFLNYLPLIFTNFQELHGDRFFADDESIVTGLAYLDHIPVVVMGQQKGADTKERLRRNFGMARPEGYRKVQRMVKMAEKFSLPILSFIDTPGAYPGIDAEERGQAQAIGQTLLDLSKVSVPIISTIIGEGGSGGALALGVADCVMMLQYSIYSVISPEGCAAILFKDRQFSKRAAEVLGLTSTELLKHKIVDKILPEPLGGAHRSIHEMAKTIKTALKTVLLSLQELDTQTLLKNRQKKLMNYGVFAEIKDVKQKTLLRKSTKEPLKKTLKSSSLDKSSKKKTATKRTKASKKDE